MSEQEQTQASPEDELDEAGALRGTLVKRLVVAGSMVGVLLGALAFVDYLAEPEEEAQVFTKPVPVPAKKEVTQPVRQAENLPEPPSEAAQAEAPKSAKTEPEGVPSATATKVSVPEAPPKPEVPAQPSMPEPRPSVLRPLVKPADPQVPRLNQAPQRAVPEATSAPMAPMPRTVETKVAEHKASEPRGSEPKAPESRPAEPKVADAPVRPMPTMPRLFSGFVVQAGVFANAQRAEELHAKLTLNGIPSTLEARVQVGPFKTRQEAEAASEKLKALGIDAVLVPPAGGRR